MRNVTQPKTSKSARNRKANCVESLEARRLLDALVLDVTSDRFEGGANPAPGNDDTAAVVAANSYQPHTGDPVNIWNGTDSDPYTVAAGDTFGGLYFPPGEYSLSGRLLLKNGSEANPLTYTGVAATYGADGSVTSAGSVIKDTNSIDHFAFGIGSQGGPPAFSYITIQNLTFDDCGVAALDAPVDNLHITGNLIRNDVLHSGAVPEWNGAGAIFATHGLTNSSISNNVFKDNEITFGIFINGGVCRNVDIDNNVFANCVRGIKLILYLVNNEDISVSQNKGIGLSQMLIEIQGGTGSQGKVNGLVISQNKASGFVNHTNHTMGISAPISGPDVLGMVVSGNEISDIPEQGVSDTGVPGVRIGLEVGGRTNTPAGQVGVLVQGNKLYGLVTPINLTGGVQRARVETSAGDIVYYTGNYNSGYEINEYGVLDDGGNTSYAAALAPEDLPTGIGSKTVAFDAWVTGTGTADTYTVNSDRTITKGTSTPVQVGLIPDTSGIKGLGAGRAVLGRFNGDTVIVNGSVAYFTGVKRSLTHSQPPKRPEEHTHIHSSGPQTLASLSVTGGTARVAQHKSPNDPGGTIVTGSLSITGGVLDLTNNSMIIDYTGSVGMLVNDVRQHLQSGRMQPKTGLTRLGYGDNAVLELSSFAGQTVDASSILIKYTYAGDADFDGDVDVADLGILASSWQTSKPWTGADFDYSGFVDVADLGLLASNWQAGVEFPSDETFNEAWNRIRGGGRAGPDSEPEEDAYESIAAELGLSAEELAAILAVWGANAGGPVL